MNLQKNQQRDPWHFSLWLLGWLTRRGCPSYVDYKFGHRQCAHRLGHCGRHGDGEITWGYGDNWLE